VWDPYRKICKAQVGIAVLAELLLHSPPPLSLPFRFQNTSRSVKIKISTEASCIEVSLQPVDLRRARLQCLLVTLPGLPLRGMRGTFLRRCRVLDVGLIRLTFETNTQLITRTVFFVK